MSTKADGGAVRGLLRAAARDVIAGLLAVAGIAVAVYALRVVGGFNPPALGMYLSIGAAGLLVAQRRAGSSRWTGLVRILVLLAVPATVAVTAFAVAFCGLGTLVMQACEG